MIKKFFLLAVSIAVIVPVLFASGEPSVNRSVLNSFREKFGETTQVNWRKINENQVYIGRYIKDGVRKEAFFNEEGKLIGEGQYIAAESLPLTIQKIAGSVYPGYEITEAYEYHPAKTIVPVYAITVENKKEKLQLKIDEFGNMSVADRKKQTPAPAPVSQSARRLFTGFDEAAFKD